MYLLQPALALPAYTHSLTHTHQQGLACQNWPLAANLKLYVLPLRSLLAVKCLCIYMWLELEHHQPANLSVLEDQVLGYSRIITLWKKKPHSAQCPPTAHSSWIIRYTDMIKGRKDRGNSDTSQPVMEALNAQRCYFTWLKSSPPYRHHSGTQKRATYHYCQVICTLPGYQYLSE